MSSLQSAIMIIMAEVSFILTAIMGYLVYRYLRTNRDMTSAIRKLADKIRGKKDDRLAMLHDFLTHTCHYSEEQANNTAAELIEKERSFYNSLMQTYMHRDHDALANLDNKTEEITGAYRNLLSASEKAITDDVQQELETRIKQLTNTINELNEKNETLSSEINKLKQEMDVTVEEYSSAFRNKQVSEADTDEDSRDISPGAPPPANKETPAGPGMAAEDDADESVEPDFIGPPHSKDVKKPVSGDSGDSADDEINKDLEALAAELDSDSAEDKINPSIPLDGLDDEIVNDIVKADRGSGQD